MSENIIHDIEREQLYATLILQKAAVACCEGAAVQRLETVRERRGILPKETYIEKQNTANAFHSFHLSRKCPSTCGSMSVFLADLALVSCIGSAILTILQILEGILQLFLEIVLQAGCHIVIILHSVIDVHRIAVISGL